jgi:hypothetical protein
VVEILAKKPGIGFHEAARLGGVSETTVRRIWEGSLPRPPVIVLDRLSKPKRCAECGALCAEWPCVFCSMRRRRRQAAVAKDLPLVRFKYKNSGK